MRTGLGIGVRAECRVGGGRLGTVRELRPDGLEESLFDQLEEALQTVDGDFPPVPDGEAGGDKGSSCDFFLGDLDCTREASCSISRQVDSGPELSSDSLGSLGVLSDMGGLVDPSGSGDPAHQLRAAAPKPMPGLIKLCERHYLYELRLVADYVMDRYPRGSRPGDQPARLLFEHRFLLTFSSPYSDPALAGQRERIAEDYLAETMRWSPLKAEEIKALTAPGSFSPDLLGYDEHGNPLDQSEAQSGQTTQGSDPAYGRPLELAADIRVVEAFLDKVIRANVVDLALYPAPPSPRQ